MGEPRHTNPMHGPNRFKLGVFSANCDGGLTMSLAPERWPANWDDIVAMCQIADRAGMEFILPVAKWRGYQGKANIYGKSFETMTHSAAIGALTKQICVFSTIHVPLVTPAFAAKAIATIDHITHGRAGLNIVCGWNQEEFDLHGVTDRPGRPLRPRAGMVPVWSRMLEGGPEFDWDGRFFKLQAARDQSGLGAAPAPARHVGGLLAQGPGFRGAGRRCPVHHHDGARSGAGHAGERGPARGQVRPAPARLRHGPRGVPADPQEAEEFYHYFAEDLADAEGQAYYRRQRGTTSRRRRQDPVAAAREPLHAREREEVIDGAYPGTYPFVGTPDDVASEMAHMSAAGLAGTSVAFLDYLKEIPYFVQEVLPRLERLGLRDAPISG